MPSDEPVDIVATAISAGSFTKLADALTTAGLVETLQGDGPFTVFAPTDAAFEAFEAENPGVLESLTVEQLTQILTYHVIAGKHSAADIMADIKKMDGKAMYKTVAGGELTFSSKDGALWVWDASGGSAKVTIADVNQSNGVIHVIDTVLIPKA